jgi:hypothetical protein
MSGSLRAIYSENPQQYADNLRAYLDQNGIPPTAENLNRISLAVTQDMRGGLDQMPSFETAVERTMQPRRVARAPATPAQPQVRLDAGASVPEGEAASIANVREGAMRTPQQPADNAHTADTNAGPVRQQMEERPTRGAQVAADNDRAAELAGTDRRSGPTERARQDGNLARPGTIPRARYVDENDPMAGFMDPNAVGGRQADETGVDQTALGLTILGALVPGIAGGAVAGGRNAVQQRLMANRVAQAGGREGMPAMPQYVDPMRARVMEAGAGRASAPAPAPTATPSTATPARVTVESRGGSAVRDPYAPGGDSAGRTALTRGMGRPEAPSREEAMRRALAMSRPNGGRGANANPPRTVRQPAETP